MYMDQWKHISWDSEKNELLKQARDISFEEIVIAIYEGRVMEVMLHPNTERYPHQFQITVWVNDYAYLVPYVQDEQKIFLKTIIPSRKATKKFRNQFTL